MAISDWFRTRLLDFVMRQMNELPPDTVHRRVDRLVEDCGLRLESLDRFRAAGSGMFAQMYRGVAVKP
jgi:hypothetical protein